MGELFGSIYCLLEDFYGMELAEYLWGQASPLQVSNMYIGIGLTMLLVSLAAVVMYYYVVDHPRLSNWWGWLIFLATNAVINFIIGWQWVLKDKYEGLMVKKDTITGSMVDLPISYSDICAFGVANMIYSIIVFIIVSCIIKWKSTNCSGAPF